MLSVPPERALDGRTLEILRYLDDTLSEHGTDYFVIGAIARDILMYHIFGIPTGRATRDVDFAIALENWDQFERIKQMLLDTGRFSTSEGTVHRLHFAVGSHGFGYPLDLIPFGGIESSEKQIAWPPDQQIVMNVAGYEKALQAANPVEVDAGLSIKVVSIPGLAALKLLAWADRGLRDTKDAQDLYFLLKNYTRAGNETRLYDHAMRLLTDCDFDPDLAGAALLGFDCGRTMGVPALIEMHAILNDRSRHDRLVLHMGGRAGEPEGNALQYLKKFQEGLLLEELAG